MLTSGFFNSVGDDRKYPAGFFARYFASFIGNGVFPNPSSNMQIMATVPNNMTVKMSIGVAWINGYVAFNDDDYILNIDVADGVLNRIDRIVLKEDPTLARGIDVYVKKGVPGSTPVAQTLQRDADAYELALADIYVGKGVISITQSNITDQRLNSALCGIVHGVVDQVDTTTLFNQYESWYTQTTGQAQTDIEIIKAQFISDFNDWYTLNTTTWSNEFTTWFDSIKGQLAGDVATNLAAQITDLQSNKANQVDLTTLDTQVSQHLADDNAIKHKAKTIALEDTANKFTATNVEGGMLELFTNVSNGKQAVGTAITGVDNSVVIPTDPTFGDLASAIGGISTGKRWASGQIAASSTTLNFTKANGTSDGRYYLEVTGLDFIPSTIIIHNEFTSTGITREHTVLHPTSFLGLTEDDRVSYGTLTTDGSADNASTIMKLTGNAYCNATGFRLPLRGGADTQGKTHSWIAFE